MRIDKFWVVTLPKLESVLEDVLFETDIKGLALQFRGGLREDDIHAVFTDKELASKEAAKVLGAFMAYQTAIRRQVK
jgi:hypothetical protein